MSACAVHAPELPVRKKVSVNGVAIAHAQIAREAQNHRAESPAGAFAQAARALAIRELLLQEARRLDLAPEPASDDEGRRETEEEALIRALIESQTPQDEPDEESCRRFYDKNLARFRSADLFEAAHILIAAAPTDAKAVAAAQEAAARLIDLLQSDPSGFAHAARVYSACTSRDQGGALGQFARGQCAPEFEEALDKLAPGEISAEPAQTVHGLHVLRLDRKIEGATLPFDFVRPRIAEYLGETRGRHAIAGYIAHLAQQAKIEGVAMAPTGSAS
jgi:peptidyl-prolyl cis-trans isomerase C